MKFFAKRKVEIGLLLFLCIVAFYLRSYGLYRDLLFAYDQGRDAFATQKILQGDITLIGPTTGLTGVFLGPFWFYFITPLYLIGSGSPMVAAYVMALFHVGVVLLLYLFASKVAGKTAGFATSILYTFSFSNILFSRWLSNPTTLPFFALLGFYLLWKAIEEKKLKFFVLSGVVFGICLQLEAANAVWFIPTVALIVLYEYVILSWKNIQEFRSHKLQPLLQNLFGLGLGGVMTLVPQFIFELKHNFLVTKNLIAAFQTTHEKTLSDIFVDRVELLYELYARGLFVNHHWLFGVTLIFLLGCIAFYWKQLWSSRGWRMIFLWFVVPLVFHATYTGNHGNFWDYYILSQHLVLYLLLVTTFVIVLQQNPKNVILKLGLGVFVVVSAMLNFAKWTEILQPYENRYSLQMQVDETHWMIEQASGEDYGVWVYAPNYQDDPHRYVFSWIGKKTGIQPKEHVEQQPLIFLAVEEDGYFPARREAWIREKMAFGELLATKKFGAITVYKLKNTFIQKQ